MVKTAKVKKRCPSCDGKTFIEHEHGLIKQPCPECLETGEVWVDAPKTENWPGYDAPVPNHNYQNGNEVFKPDNAEGGDKADSTVGAADSRAKRPGIVDGVDTRLPSERSDTGSSGQSDRSDKGKTARAKQPESKVAPKKV